MSSRVAVVTGANKGIGYEIVRGLLTLGESNLRVVLCSRDAARGAESLSKLRQEFPAKASLVTTEQLEIGSTDSIADFTKVLTEKYNRLDVLVHNAAFAYKNSDPTPFYQQAAPTMNVNYFGTLNLHNSLLPLLHHTRTAFKVQPRIIFIASQAGTWTFNKLSSQKQQQFSTATTIDQVNALVRDFVSQVQKLGPQAEKLISQTGFSASCYGTSKLAIIAATKILAKQLKEQMFVASMCPGYCKTDMSSWGGDRSAEKGAETAVWLSLLRKSEEAQTGKFWYDKKDISFI